uniref:ribosomal protein L32 n=1 Tax=Agapetes malipoensis TaxID=2876857 RepID=UPI001D10BF4F|nr:ribosomal protein L32 [Agapetes malipoensis]YP_010205982.1 ribosomal protein L32 [Agapetes malipoensis]UAX04325.1 ribosomal protein L32 [Agapetes malipoensis]UAX04327.1 ribosomal protein L32 [Agapetes malipoensis]
MGVPKKRTSISKKRIRKNIWKRKGYWAALKAFSLGKCVSTGNSKSFCVGQKNLTTNAKGFFVRQRNK